jgi:hypothetical protein
MTNQHWQSRDYPEPKNIPDDEKRQRNKGAQARESHTGTQLVSPASGREKKWTLLERERAQCPFLVTLIVLLFCSFLLLDWYFSVLLL